MLPSYAWRRRLGIGVHSFAAATAGNRATIEADLAWYTAVTGRLPATLLELGPGDTIANAMYAAARGVRQIWLMDVGDHASSDMAEYRAIAATLPADFTATLDFTSRATLLASLNTTYLTAGPPSLRAIPDGSIDLTVSYTVLEHVRRADFARLLADLHRLSAKGGLAHHLVDLMDHLGGGLNHLRFGDALWEHPAIATSGFYTNRLSQAEIIAAAEAAGFETAVPYALYWSDLPPANLHRQFTGRTAAELRVANFGLYLRR